MWRNLSGIFIFDKLEGEEKPIPTCIEDCTPETRLKWLEAQGKPYMCTSDMATWVGVDNKWYYVYRPGISTSIIPLLELTKDEDEMFNYLKDIFEFGHENPHN